MWLHVPFTSDDPPLRPLFQKLILNWYFCVTACTLYQWSFWTTFAWCLGWSKTKGSTVLHLNISTVPRFIRNHLFSVLFNFSFLILVQSITVERGLDHVKPAASCLCLLCRVEVLLWKPANVDDKPISNTNIDVLRNQSPPPTVYTPLPIPNITHALPPPLTPPPQLL